MGNTSDARFGHTPSKQPLRIDLTRKSVTKIEGGDSLASLVTGNEAFA